MARSVAAILFACLCAGSAASASECRSLDDGVALPQKAVRLHFEEAEEMENEEERPGMAPSHSRQNKNRKLLRESLDGAFKRAIQEMQLPDAVGVFRWEMVGKVTQYLMNYYQKPKTPALLSLLDDVILLAHDTLGQKDVMTIKESEMIKRLANITRAADIAQHFVDRMDDPPKTLTSVVSAVTEAAHGNPTQLKFVGGNLTIALAQRFGKEMVSRVNKTSPEVAELVSYAVDVGSGKRALDPAHVLELHMPWLQAHGAPPAVLDYVKEEADRQRNHVALGADERHSKIMNMMSTSAKQLGLPPAFAEIAETMGKEPPHTEEEKKALAYDLSELLAKVNDQLDGPSAISELIHRVGGVLKGKPMPSNSQRCDLLARATTEIGLPSAVADLIKLAGSVEEAPDKKLDAKKAQDLVKKAEDLSIELGQQLGAPQVLTTVAQKFTEYARAGRQLSTEQVMALVAYALDDLELPAVGAIASFLSKVMNGGDAQMMMDPTVLMSLVQSLVTVQSDFEKMQGIVDSMAGRLLNPLKEAHKHTMAKLLGGMKKPSNFNAVHASA